ncbi:MAG: hypothetical protein GY806_11055 [Gammaproteobacteria bacterium]|nr:hypothetical protein [Gammaproteobacteria bacterium]
MQSSKAGTLSGVNDPDFLMAVDTWLSDNDSGSLPVLSALSNKGNIAARLLLSRIEITDRASGNFVRQMSRSERVDLFRSNFGNGVFRLSWIKVEADRGNPIARALLDGTSLGINIAAIKHLYEIGEFEATEHLVRKVAVDGSQSERRELAQLLISGSELTPYLRGFRFTSLGMTTGRAALQYITGMNEGIDPDSIGLDNDPDTRTAMKFVDFGYQAGAQTIGYWDKGKHFDAIVKWTMTAPQAMAVANLCRRDCSDQQISACAITGFGLVGGYYEMIRFDSPLENIIPQDRFLNSERAIGMALRRIASARTEAGVKVFSDIELSKKSQCLAQAVTKLKIQSNYKE